MLSAYRSAAAQLRLDEGETDEATTARLLGWLYGTEQPWVVVLDDVIDPEDVHDLLPYGPNGLTIVTTRWNTAAIDAGAFKADVGVYTPRRRRSSSGDVSGA